MKNKKALAIIGSLLLVTLAASVLYLVVIKDDTSSTGAGTKPKTCTTYNNTVEEQCIEDYIGLSQGDAIARAKQYKYIPKIVSIDGVEQPNLDIAGAIIHLVIENGFVVRGYFNTN